MAQGPLEDADGPVDVRITSDGTVIPGEYAVVAVRTRAETNRIPEAVIVIQDGDVSTGEFPVTDAAQFKPGAAIQISVGYGSGEAKLIFGGIVTANRLRLRSNRSELEVTCRDKAFLLQFGQKSQCYTSQKDSDVLSAIIGAVALTHDVETTSDVRAQLMRSRATDWDFILARAEANGLVVTIFDGKVTIKKPDAGSAPVISLTYGVDIVSFDAEVDLSAQYSDFIATSWDPNTQTGIKMQASVGQGMALGNITPSYLAEKAGSATFAVETSSLLTAAELATLANARMSRAALATPRGTMSFQGCALAKLGGTIEITGMSDRFNGTALITGVVHRIEDGNWITETGFGLAATWNSERGLGIEAAPAAAELPPLRSLQIGKVAKLSGDPDGKSRLQVRLTTLVSSTGETLLWARHAAPYAGEGRGLMMLPEIGDEVIVGFLDGDPSTPVILGALHSVKNTFPVPPKDENHFKVFMSRKGLTLAFDEEKKVITLVTPGKNSVELSDDTKSITLKDQHGNKIVMDSNGILIDSSKDLQIKAKGKGAVEAAQDVTLKGMNVQATAQVGFKATGGASAEVSAGGTTTIKGAMVMIN